MNTMLTMRVMIVTTMFQLRLTISVTACSYVEAAIIL